MQFDIQCIYVFKYLYLCVKTKTDYLLLLVLVSIAEAYLNCDVGCVSLCLGGPS